MFVCLDFLHMPLVSLIIFNGAKLGVAPVARAPPLFLPRPELKYIYVLHTSAPPRTYLVRATLLLSPDWRHWKLAFRKAEYSVLHITVGPLNV